MIVVDYERADQWGKLVAIMEVDMEQFLKPFDSVQNCVFMNEQSFCHIADILIIM